MLVVTSAAKNKIWQILQKDASGTDIAIRISFLPHAYNKVGLVFDRERRDDHVVRSSLGAKLVLVSPEVLEKTGAMILDYTDTPNGERFLIGPV